MTIVYNSDHLELVQIEQYSKKGDDGVRFRDGHLNVWVYDDGLVSIDPVQNRIGEDGEYVCDCFKLTIHQAEEFARSILAGVDAWHEEFGSEDYEAYEAARGGLKTSNGWNPGFPETSLVYDADGNCLGRLVSVDPAAVAGEGGIHPHSQGDLPVSEVKIGDIFRAREDLPVYVPIYKGGLVEITSLNDANGHLECAVLTQATDLKFTDRDEYRFVFGKEDIGDLFERA